MTLYYAIGFMELFAILLYMFARLSFAVFLLALISPTRKWKRGMLWSVIIIQVLIHAITVSRTLEPSALTQQS